MAQKGEVAYDPGLHSASDLAGFVNDIGFTASVLDNEGQGHNTLDVLVSLHGSHFLFFDYLNFLINLF